MPQSPRGHPIPEENQPQFCASPNKTLCPHHSLHFIATLRKIPQAACDLLLASDGALGFKTRTHQAIERTLREVAQGFAVTCLEVQRSGSWQGEPALTAPT